MKRFLKIALIFILVMIVIIAAGGFYFSKRIKPIIISQLNQQLTVKVDVSEIQLSKFSNFPKLGVRFSDVVVDESSLHYGKPVLEARDLYLYVDVLKLLSKEYVIDAITIEDGTILLANTIDGSNFDVFKTDTSSESDLSFAIEDLHFKNCVFQYQDAESEFIAAGTFSSAKAQLYYSDTVTQIKVKGNLLADSIKQSEDFYLKGQELALNTELLLANNNERITITPSELLVEGVTLNTSGMVLIEDETYVDLRFKNQQGSINDIIAIVPDYVKLLFEHLDLSGDAVVDAYFTGKIGEAVFPSFGFNYDITDATIKTQDAVSLNHVHCSGELRIPSLGNMRTAWVKGKLTKAASGSSLFKGDFAIENFQKPFIKWQGDASMEAKTLFAILDVQDLEVNSGKILANGKLEMIYDPDKEEIASKSFKYIGEFKGVNISGKLKDPELNIHQVDFELLANDKHVVIKQCDLNYEKTKASLVGYIRNSDQMFSSKSATEISGRLDIDHLNVNELMSSDTSSAEAVIKELFPYHLLLETHIRNLKFNDFIAESLDGTLKSNRKQLQIPNAKLVALGGSADANLRFSTLGDYYVLAINSKVQKMNITRLFKEFNNFEQTEITSKHLSGSMSGSLQTTVMFDKDFEPALDKLYAKADIEIVDGQLKGYEPLKELSSFVEVSELENVKFSSLKNTIEIFDQTIFIPKMHIGNSAMSLDIEGTHNFENFMDYHLELSLIELMAQKSNWFAKKQEKRLEDNEHGGLTAYIHMRGTPDDLKITYDKVGMKKVLSEELQQEKKDFLKIIRGEELEDETPETYYEDIWDE